MTDGEKLELVTVCFNASLDDMRLAFVKAAESMQRLHEQLEIMELNRLYGLSN